jgi:hypothetical protein
MVSQPSPETVISLNARLGYKAYRLPETGGDRGGPGGIHPDRPRELAAGGDRHDLHVHARLRGLDHPAVAQVDSYIRDVSCAVGSVWYPLSLERQRLAEFRRGRDRGLAGETTTHVGRGPAKDQGTAGEQGDRVPVWRRAGAKGENGAWRSHVQGRTEQVGGARVVVRTDDRDLGGPGKQRLLGYLAAIGGSALSAATAASLYRSSPVSAP